MATDIHGNTVMKKDFMADGGWRSMFFLLPLLLVWVALDWILLWGAYVTLRYELDHAKAAFLFLLFASLASLIAVPLARALWTLFTEKIVFTDDRVIYHGFRSYALPYRTIKGVTLCSRKGAFGRERFLVFVSDADLSRGRFFVIPRWKALANGALQRELSRRMTLSLLDQSLLSSYAPQRGSDFAFTIFLGAGTLFAIVLFFFGKTASGAGASLVVALWIALAGGLLFVLSRFFGGNREMAKC